MRVTVLVLLLASADLALYLLWINPALLPVGLIVACLLAPSGAAPVSARLSRVGAVLAGAALLACTVFFLAEKDLAGVTILIGIAALALGIMRLPGSSGRVLSGAGGLQRTRVRHSRRSPPSYHCPGTWATIQALMPP